MTRLPNPPANSHGPGGAEPADPSEGSTAGAPVNGSGTVSAAVVAGLAREVDALRRAIRANADLPARLTDLANTVADLADELNTRRRASAGGLVAASWLDRHGVPEPDPATDPPAEAAADGEPAPPSAGEVLAELAGWVGRVFLRYRDADAVFPECWLYHPEIVEELLWLRLAWQNAYSGPGASVAGVGDWHDRYRPGVVRRIRAYSANCSLSKHTVDPDAAPDLEFGRAPHAEAADAVAEWWTDGHLGGGPAPTPEQLRRSADRYRRDGRGR